MLVLTFTYQVGVVGVSLTTSKGLEAVLMIVFVVNVLMICVLVAYFFIKLPDENQGENDGQSVVTSKGQSSAWTLKGYRSMGSRLSYGSATESYGSATLLGNTDAVADRLHLQAQLRERDDLLQRQDETLRQRDETIRQLQTLQVAD